jgi:O-antigen ligase
MKGLLFTYALTYGGSAVALVNPFVGLLIYCSFAIIKPDALWPWSVPVGNYSRIIAICLLIGWAGQGFGEWTFGRARAIAWALLGFFAWSALSTVFVTEYQTAWIFVDNTSKIVIPWVVGITVIRTLSQVRLLAWVLVFSQAYIALEKNRDWIFGNREMAQEGFAGADNNTLAITMVTAAGLAYFLGITTNNIKLRWLAFASAGLMAHYPMFANSRGGMLALIIVGCLSFLLIAKQPRHYLYFAFAVVIGLRLAGPSVWERFGTTFVAGAERDYSAQSRVDLWEDAWDMMNRFPVFGIGPDNFGTVIVEYGWPPGKECHSLWMQTGAELGFPGLFFLAAFYVLCVVQLWRVVSLTAEIDRWWAGLSRAVVAALCGFICSSQFVTVDGIELPYYVALIGALVAKLAPESVAETYVLRPSTCPLPSA